MRRLLVASYLCLMMVRYATVCQGMPVEEADPAVFTLEELVVRSWHVEEKILEVPADVTMIDREMIEDALALTTPELLEAEANLFFTTVSGSTSLDMRGFGANSGLRSLVLVDGQPLNPADMGRMNWEQIPPESIESIEVLRGGHNVLYGNQALAGVIRIETRKPQGSLFEAAGRLESFGGSQASVVGGLGSNDWNIGLDFSRYETEGYRENSARNSSNSNLRISGDLTQRITFDGRLALSRSDLLYPGPLNARQYKENPRQAGTPFEDGSESGSAKASFRLAGDDGGLGWELVAGYDQNEVDYEFFTSNSFGENEEKGLLFKPRLSRKWDDLTVILGLDYTNDQLDSTRYDNAEKTVMPGMADISEDRFGSYLFVEHELSPALSLSGGFRHEWNRYEVAYTAFNTDQQLPFIEKRGGAVLIPNPDYQSPPDVVPEDSFRGSLSENGQAVEFSLNWGFTRRSSLWLGYDRVYRYPVFDERSYYQGFGQPFFNMNLRPEEGDNFEAGLKYLGERHQLYLTGYFLKMENEIAFDSSIVGGTGAGLNVNLGPVHRHGLDLTWQYSGENWGVSVSASYLHTEIRSGDNAGNEVPEVPGFRMTNRLWWEPVESLRLSLLHRYVGERYPGNDTGNQLSPLGSYQLYDAGVTYATSPNSRVFLKVENLFDELYPEATTNEDFYPGDGRKLAVGVKLSF